MKRKEAIPSGRTSSSVGFRGRIFMGRTKSYYNPAFPCQRFRGQVLTLQAMVTLLRILVLASIGMGAWPRNALGGKPGDWPAATRKVGLDPAAAPNTLPASEQALGWRLLFDG